MRFYSGFRQETSWNISKWLQLCNGPAKWERELQLFHIYQKKLKHTSVIRPRTQTTQLLNTKSSGCFHDARPLPAFHHSLWIPISKSDEMETSCWEDCHSALNTLFLWALIERDGLGALYRISKMWITGSEEPDEMCKPSGDQDWLISADCDSLLSCFHPKENSSVWGNLTSYNRSCLSSCLQAK